MRRAAPILAFLAAAAALVAVVDRGGDDGGAPAGRPSDGRVLRIVDGDTIHVRVGGRDERVRYIGIDTPEEVKPGTPVQCYARAAAAANRRLVAGQEVRLVPDVEARDRYGRLLAYVFRAGDGRFVNEVLVREGFARTLTIPPNVRYADRLSALAGEARRAGRGLWSACG
jgi:micrococcal nuclease